MIALLLWAPWVLFAVLLVLAFRYKRATHARADPALAHGKWVVVTGAASGIGLATALELLKLGANVVACDVNLAALESAFKAFGEDRVKKLRVDVTSQADVDELARAVAKLSIAGLVNSAGVASPPKQKRTTVLGGAEVDVDRDVIPVYDVNVFGLSRVTSALFPQLFESRGTIVNLASVAGRLTAPGFSVYSGTKHAVVAYSAALRRELAPYAMKVFSVEPGFTDTAMVAKPLQVGDDGPDLSRTRLTKAFSRVAAPSGFAKLVGALQSVDKVAVPICAMLFSAEWMPPHVVIDESKFWVFVIGSMLPHWWVDAAVALSYN